MKTKKQIEQELEIKKKDLNLYRVLSILLLLIFIIYVSFMAINKPQNPENDSQLLLSTDGQSATLNLDLAVPQECLLAQVWKAYLEQKNGEVTYPFTIKCPQS